MFKIISSNTEDLQFLFDEEEFNNLGTSGVFSERVCGVVHDKKPFLKNSEVDYLGYASDAEGKRYPSNLLRYRKNANLSQALATNFLKLKVKKKSGCINSQFPHPVFSSKRRGVSDNLSVDKQLLSKKKGYRKTREVMQANGINLINKDGNLIF